MMRLFNFNLSVSFKFYWTLVIIRYETRYILHPRGVTAPEVLGSIANSWQLVSNTLMRTTIIIIVDEARDAFT